MYFIIQIQKNKEGVGSTLVTTKETRNEAESEYHRILQYAALSTIPKHGAIIIDDDCAIHMTGCYTHEQEEQQPIE